MKVWWLLCACLLCALSHAESGPPPVLRVAVVGGLRMSGVWPRLAARVEAATGVHLETVAAAPKDEIVPQFVAGDADLMLIHGSDETYALLADAYAAPLRAWARNEHVIVGPVEDPAGVAQATSAADALARIVRADAPMMLFRDPGSFALVQGALRRAGVRPGARQQLYDDAERPQQVLQAAARLHAYVLVGHIPVAMGKMPNPGGLATLFKGDPLLRRVYVAVEPGPLHPADAARRVLAHRVADYLVSAAGQNDLVAADQEIPGGPWLYPVKPASQAPPPPP